MFGKHFVNDPTEAVLGSIESLVLTNPSLCLDRGNKIIYRHPASLASDTKVCLISGGGSGHEPVFGGYVGRGLLAASIAGTIFASPSSGQIHKCIALRVPSSAPILVIVMNYTGDVLNFGMAIEKAKRADRKLEMIVVGDDVGVGREKSGKVGRRGLAGVVLVVKICGALAELAFGLNDIARVGKTVSENLVSIGISLSRSHVPGRPMGDATVELERLPNGISELGMGIHNEAGCEKLNTDLIGTVKTMLKYLIDMNDRDRAFVRFEAGGPLILLVNNFGGLSNLEMGAITTEIWKQLTTTYQLEPVRTFSGVFNGSLNGLGFGITLLRLTSLSLGKLSMLDLIDFPTEAVGWPAAIQRATWETTFAAVGKDDQEPEVNLEPGDWKVDAFEFRRILESGLKNLIAAEPDITRFDEMVGDGDCGTVLKRGAEAIISMLKESELTGDLTLDLSSIVRVVESTMDGTSGALYAIFLNAVTRDFGQRKLPEATTATTEIWIQALQSAMQTLAQYTPAKPGDRTVLDALCPFVEELQRSRNITTAAAAATEGAKSTRGMQAKLGRTVYVGGEGWLEVPDPGAHALSEFLRGLAGAL